MDQLIGGKPGAPAGDVVKDTNTASFRADVLEASMQVPVIVDFWAPWCGPCKQLGPAIEKAVKEARGAVRMVKINVGTALNTAFTGAGTQTYTGSNLTLSGAIEAGGFIIAAGNWAGTSTISGRKRIDQPGAMPFAARRGFRGARYPRDVRRSSFGLRYFGGTRNPESSTLLGAVSERERNRAWPETLQPVCHGTIWSKSAAYKG